MSKAENNQEGAADSNFGLPGGYFEQSARRILLKLEWEEEHRNYPALTSLRDTKTFSVPPDYFNQSFTKLELLETPLLMQTQRTGIFSTPADYFETAESTAFLTLATEDSGELHGCETLKKLGRQNHFAVGEGYFETSARMLYTLLEPNRQARIIDLFFARKSYVAAAMLLMCAGIWLYSVYGRPAVVQGDCGTVACLEKSDLMKAKVLESADNDELYDLVNPGDLEKQLEKGSNISNKQKADSSLDDLNVEDLQDEI